MITPEKVCIDNTRYFRIIKKDYLKTMGLKGKISLGIFNIELNYFARVVPDYV